MATASNNEKLEKTLGLQDVFAISAGAMISSGFFLLPGIAAAEAGPSVVLAYFLASLLVLPALLSQAELSTAMPKAGGTYYILDRSMGPVVGTIGGMGTWLALTLKSSFALIGMGAYLTLFIDLPMVPTAVGLVVLFTLLNIFGAKETSSLQVFLVAVLLIVLSGFTLFGVLDVHQMGFAETTGEKFSPFMPFGFESLLGTIGLVYVSYAGLTKIASVSEEVKRPERNIPLGMLLALGVTTIVYVVGVYVLVAVLEPDTLYADLTPIATAANEFLGWMPGATGTALIVVAAVAAFASTGNAGLLSASRDFLAMARDRLMPDRFTQIGSFGTPVPAILLTSGFMIFFIVGFDTEAVAKLASAFQLIVLGFINLAVIVMRESKIESYDPDFQSPFYPWIQLVGIAGVLIIIPEMGLLSVLFSGGLAIMGIVWYIYYASERVNRSGAFRTIMKRLGGPATQLDRDLREIMKDKGLRSDDPYNEIVWDAHILQLDDTETWDDFLDKAFAEMDMLQGEVTEAELRQAFDERDEISWTPDDEGISLPHMRLESVSDFKLVMGHAPHGIDAPNAENPVYAVFFMVGPTGRPRQHLRIMAAMADKSEEDGFIESWRTANDEEALRQLLFRNELVVEIKASEDTTVREFDLPDGCLISYVYHDGELTTPSGDTALHKGDTLVIIGSQEGLQAVREQFQTQ